MAQLSYLWFNYLNSVYLSVANMDGITFCVMRGGSLVDFTNFVRRDVGSNLNIASLIERFNQCARQLLSPHLEYYMIKPVQMISVVTNMAELVCVASVNVVGMC